MMVAIVVFVCVAERESVCVCVCVRACIYVLKVISKDYQDLYSASVRIFL